MDDIQSNPAEISLSLNINIHNFKGVRGLLISDKPIYLDYRKLPKYCQAMTVYEFGDGLYDPIEAKVPFAPSKIIISYENKD